MITALVGVILLIRAAALAVIALTVSVGTYVLVARPVGWGIIGVGAAVMVWMRRRSGEPKQPHRREAHSDGANDRRADLADEEEPDDDVENAEWGMLRADRPRPRPTSATAVQATTVTSPQRNPGNTMNREY